MRPPPFLYRRVRSSAEALDLLSRYGDEARLLAGGQSLMPLLNLRMGRPGVLIDLNACEGLSYIEDRKTHLACGPMVRQIDAQHSALIQDRAPLVSQALSWAGPIAVRNRGTVGGMLAHHDRSAELPGAAVALNAVLVVEGKSGVREVPADAFFVADLVTAINPGEMLREIRLPVQTTPHFSVFLEAGLRQRDMALVGLAFIAEPGVGRRFGSVRAAVTAVDSRPIRLTELETGLTNVELTGLNIAELAEFATRSIDPIDDTHASGRYRRSVLNQLIGEAVHRSLTWLGERA